LFNGTTQIAHGELVRMSANNTFVRAQADTSPHVAGLIGVNGSGVVGPGGPANIFPIGAQLDVLLETGLTPAAGQIVFVSATTAGRGTTVAPVIAVAVGVIEDASAYARTRLVTIGTVAGAGAVGAQGAQGFQGATGTQGAQGSAGVQGSQGAQGAQAGLAGLKIAAVIGSTTGPFPFACTFAGAAIGDIVVYADDQTGVIDATSNFEATISVTGQLQQLTTFPGANIRVLIFLRTP
jgi:hypothetical protein